MKNRLYSSIHLILLTTIFFGAFSCSSSEDKDPRGKVNFRISVNPPLGATELRFNASVNQIALLKEGGVFETDEFLYDKNENLVYQASYFSDCREITIEAIFNGKVFDKRAFELGGYQVNGQIVSTCKDGEYQTVNLITPK